MQNLSLREATLWTLPGKASLSFHKQDERDQAGRDGEIDIIGGLSGLPQT